MHLITQTQYPFDYLVVSGAYRRFFQDQQEIDWWPVGEGIDVSPPVVQDALARLEVLVEDRSRFEQLVTKWRGERGATSSTIDIVLCPSYQSIIAMGEKAIPLILGQMRAEGDDPDQWFWALQVLTGQDPVDEEDEGNFRKMAQAWLGWAAHEGYAW
jgi:hypothetical protein